MVDLEANHRDVAQAYHLLATQLCGLLLWLQEPTDEGCKAYLTGR